MALNVADLIATLGLDASKFTAGTRDASSAIGSLQRVAETFAGFQLANVFNEAVGAIKNFVVESVKLGFEANIVQNAYRNMAEQVGVSSEALIRGLKAASGGIVNETDIMQAAARGLQQGLQPEQFTRLMEIARAQSQLTGKTVTEAFNDMTQSIANQQVRALKAMGIVINLNDAFETYSRTLGVSVKSLTEVGREQAILAAVFKVTEGRLLDVNNAATRQKEAVEKAGASWTQIKEEVGQALIGVFFPLSEWFRKDAIPVIVDFGKFSVQIFREVLAGFQLMATPLAGGFAFLASIIADLSNGNLPSMKNALDNAMGAMTDWGKTAAATAGAVGASTAKTSEDVRLAATSWNQMGAAGKNAFGDISKQTKVVPEEVAKVKEAFLTLNAEMTKFGTQAQQDEQAVQDLLKPFREMLVAREITQAMFSQAEALARAAVGQKILGEAVTATTERLVHQADIDEQMTAAMSKIGLAAAEAAIEASGDEERAFRHRLAVEVAGLQELAMSLTDVGQHRRALTTIEEYEGSKRLAFFQEQFMKQSAWQQSAWEDAVSLARTETQRVEYEHQKRLGSLNALLAKGLIWEETYALAVTHLAAETLQKRLAAYATEFQGRVVSLANMESAVQGFYADESNLRLAASAEAITTQAKMATAELGWLTTINNAEQQAAVTQAGIDQARAQSKGDFFAFVGAGFDGIAAKSATVWQAMLTLEESVVSGIQSSLSTALFDYFKTGTLDMQKAWGGLVDSMLKAVTDFIAQQAVKTFLTMGGAGVSWGIGAVASFFSKGGTNTGPDTIPAWLAPGETVLSAATSRMLGLPQGTGITEAVLSSEAVQNILNAIGLGREVGAITTASGQLTTAAPEVLRNVQFAGNVFEGLSASGAKVAADAMAAGATAEAARAAAVGSEASMAVAAEQGTAGTGAGFSGLSDALAVAGVLYNLYGTATAFERGNIATGIGTLGGMAVGAGIGWYLGGPVGALYGAGIGGSIGGFLGSLFEGAPELTHAQREAKETASVLGAAAGYAQLVAGSTSLGDLYANLRSFQTGYVGGTSPFAIDVGLRAGGGLDRVNYLGLYGAVSGGEPTLTREQFLAEAIARPGDLFAGIQAGVGQENLAAANAAFADVVRLRIKELAGGSVGTMVVGGSGGSGLTGGLVIPGGAYLAGFQAGGGFVVGGAGGPDSQLVSFMASPGEQVNVTPSGRRRGGGTIVINISALDASSIDQRTIDKLTRAVRNGMARLNDRTYAVGGAARG